MQFPSQACQRFKIDLGIVITNSIPGFGSCLLGARCLHDGANSQSQSRKTDPGVCPIEHIVQNHSTSLHPSIERNQRNRPYSPSFSQIASIFALVAPSISIIAGHGRVKPSARHLRVASMPIFEP